MSMRRSHEEFVELVYKKFPNANFEILNTYENSLTKMIIRDRYGVYSLNARTLLEGKGLSFRQAVNKKEYLKNYISLNYNKDYGFDKFIYNGIKNKSTLICNYHGEFEICPDNILMGRGCRKCAYTLNSFRHNDWINMCPGNPGILYLLQLFSKQESFFKIGITCQTIKQRYSKYNMPYNYKEVSKIETHDRKFILGQELKIKNDLKQHNYDPDKKFEGCYTECFSTNNETIKYLGEYFKQKITLWENI